MKASVVPVNVTLLANGMPSGVTRIALNIANAFQTEQICPSSNWPFQSAADTFSVSFNRMGIINHFLHGYLTVTDVCNWPIMQNIPFVVYIGDEWPQAPVGLVHGIRPVEIKHNQFVLFSVLFEKAE